MLCDVCGKVAATVHLTEIINDQINELHLCEECARQKSAQMEQQFGLSDLLAGLADFEKPTKETGGATVKCPGCSLTYEDFKKIGRLGCGECYVTFKKYLGPLLKRIHGSIQHIGKSPFVKAEKKTKRKTLGLQELRHNLQKAIDNEEFEEAAKLRDQIKELEINQSNDKNESKEDNK
ncbi:MAG: UvrB/UvrC motif-containing protein [Candidatus Omnitrophica bacterium]|nr:UvrB/UvrC motif-containing protein [Candidatus Omnitrophota bacterium]